MKNIYILARILMLPLGVAFSLLASGQTITITTGEMVLDPNTTTVVAAEVLDTAGNMIENAKIGWSTEPGYLGKVSKDGVLTANHPGEGFLIAKYHDARDSVKLTVTGTPKNYDDESDDEVEYPCIKIVPDNIRVEISDSVELRAFYIDSTGTKVDTIFSWTMAPQELGSFSTSTSNLFYSNDSVGKGIIIATLGELADTAKITVYESKEKKREKEREREQLDNKGKQLTIQPGDLTVYKGHEPILYSATYKTNGVPHQNAEFIWTVSDTSIANIDANGLLTLTGETGITLIHAEYSNFEASVELLVVDSTVDLDVNTISIRRVLPDGHELKPKYFKEGESYKIGGLPYPLNILNAGMLHFPYGCIDEDIDIYMFIPEEYTELTDDSTDVNFSEEIITGVKFSVVPVGSDSIVEPYWFNTPVELKLVYKRDLLDSLGVDPHDLNVFFADSTGFVEVGDGVATVDTARNRIYASIEHFSTIVVKAAEIAASVDETKPEKEAEFLIYPNPFTSSTTIKFSLEKRTDVQLRIYNLFGQEIKVLVDGELPSGEHQIKWNGTKQNGTAATMGIYICRLIKDGEVSNVQRMIINR
ncbi:MAG TPA: FlgD immunoglobulin-like domain containing protein [Draconibacterium sp.]|nr:FlgD immunoglobulin-like domain containing protein [Draconibacterium sp.]